MNYALENARIHAERMGERKAVKQALAEHGIVAKVGHGRGTASSWIDVQILNKPEGKHINGDEPYAFCRPDCPMCAAFREQWGKAMVIARNASGRSHWTEDCICVGWA